MKSISELKENCIFCGNSEILRRRLSIREYGQCLSCGGFFLEAVSHLSPPEEKKRYAQHNNSLENRGYAAYLESFIDMCCSFPQIREVLPGKIRTVLDYGSGPEPSLAKLLSDRGFNVRISDPFFAPEAVISDGEADMITCLEVAEHFKHPVEEFQTMSRYLRLGGFLAVGTHLIESQGKPEENLDFFRSWWYRQDLTHVSFYTEQSLLFVAEKAGFEWLGQAGAHVYIFTKQQESPR
jgi:hypothetical protein